MQIGGVYYGPSSEHDEAADNNDKGETRRRRRNAVRVRVRVRLVLVLVTTHGPSRREIGLRIVFGASYV